MKKSMSGTFISLAKRRKLKLNHQYIALNFLSPESNPLSLHVGSEEEWRQGHDVHECLKGEGIAVDENIQKLMYILKHTLIALKQPEP